MILNLNVKIKLKDFEYILIWKQEKKTISSNYDMALILYLKNSSKYLITII